MFYPKQKSYYCMSYNKLEDIVKENFNVEYDFVAQQEANNYSCYVFYTDDSFRPREIIESNHCPQDVLQYLCTHNYLPYGDYLIEVYW